MKSHKLGKIIRFIKAFLRWGQSGFRRSKFAKQRQSTCSFCPHKTKKNTCDLCGCYLPTKTSWITESCPDDRW